MQRTDTNRTLFFSDKYKKNYNVKSRTPVCPYCRKLLDVENIRRDTRILFFDKIHHVETIVEVKEELQNARILWVCRTRNCAYCIEDELVKVMK